MSRTAIADLVSHLPAAHIAAPRVPSPAPQCVAESADLHVSHNDNFADDGPCPVCQGQAGADRPNAEFRGDRLHRRWLCRACGHQWTTTRPVQN
jgi:hypothetical protein